MVPLEERVLRAQQDKSEAETLILEYLPFIKKRTSNVRISGMDYEDCLSIATLVFMNCIRQYTQGKGSFLTYAGRCIHNRFIDLWRKGNKQEILMPSAAEDDNIFTEPENQLSIEQYNRQLEKEALAEEFDLYSEEIAEFGITIAELARVSPRQNRARKQCFRLAEEVVKDCSLRTEFLSTHRLPQKELAHRLGISVKTIEKHRKYLVSLCVLLSGDYPLMKSYIAYFREAVL